MTFRTASEKSSGWKHPGLERRGFLEEAKMWAEQEWEEKMLPEMKKELGIE